MNAVKWNSKYSHFFLISVVALSLATQCYFAFSGMDLYHSDEIIQCLEQAHRWVFGFGTIPNEFIVGMRNTVAIRVVALLMRVSTYFPIRSPLAYLFLIKACVLILFNWGLYGMYRYVKSSNVGLGLWAVLMLYVPFLRFGYRTLTETLSIPFIIWGVLWLREKQLSKAFMAGISLGLSVVCRYGSGVLVAIVFLFQDNVTVENTSDNPIAINGMMGRTKRNSLCATKENTAQ